MEQRKFIHTSQAQFSMLKNKIFPLPGYVLVEPIEDEQKSAGGVYLPESTKDKPMKGKVVAIGNEMWLDGRYHECPVKIGDTCLYKKWANQEVTHEGKEYLLVSFSELLAVIE